MVFTQQYSKIHPWSFLCSEDYIHGYYMLKLQLF